jgi:hypothetical protein
MKTTTQIIIVFSLLILSGCAIGPPKTLAEAQTIILTPAYDGDLKRMSEIVTITWHSPVHVRAVNNKSIGIFSNKYRELKILNYGKHVANYVHMLPGKNTIALGYLNGNEYSISNVELTIDGKAGDVLRINHERTSDSWLSRRRIVFSIENASKDYDIASEHYQRVIKDGVLK